jgi:uncharacterized protein (TIGR02996 family)
MRTFKYRKNDIWYFWNLDRQENQVSVTSGPMYRQGRTRVREYASDESARKACDRLVEKKLAEGYIETTPKPVSPLQQALEAALVEDPDDLAAHMAYADYLMEQGDPRGELIQLELEHERLPGDSRRRAVLRKRAQELVTEHGRAWLGDLATYLLEQSHTYATPFRFTRGWVHTLYLENLTVDLARSVATAPEARLLHTLRIEGVAHRSQDSYQPGDDTPAEGDCPSLLVLFASVHLCNLRLLRVRGYDLGRHLGAVVLSPILGRLTHLEIQDPNLGLAGIEALATSGILDRLKTLDLRRCGLTDFHAEALAEAPLGNLELLNLDDNQLTEHGIRILLETGVPLQAADQGLPDDDEEWD